MAALALWSLALPALAAQTAPTTQKAATTPLVRVPFPRDDGPLTPYGFEFGYQLMTLVYDTLLWRDAEGVPQPWLAKSVEASPDGRRLTIRLAEGVKWHDGVPLTAADVAFTFSYVAAHPHPRFSAELEAVQRVEAQGPATVLITLRRSSPGFADQPLADLPIMPAHLWRDLPGGRAAPDGLPVGSGPYRLVEHAEGKRYRFEANADYFRGAPAVHTIQVPIITDSGATLAAMQGGRVDLLPLSLTAGLDQNVDLLGTRIKEGPSYLGTVLVFNTRKAPFDRIEVRRAVAQALDLDRIARSVTKAVPASRGYLHPESSWASPEALHRFDGVAARRALAAFGLAPIEVLAANDDPVERAAATEVALALIRVGVRAEAKTVPRPELSAAVGDDGSVPSFALAVGGAAPLASYDPDFLRLVFGSGPFAVYNRSGYRSPAFDALADRIGTTLDIEARRGAVNEALKLIASDAPVVPLLFANGVYSYRTGVYDGWVFVKGSGILDKRSFVEPAQPPPTLPPAGSDPASAAGKTAGSDRDFLAWAALAVAAVAVGLAVVALVGRFRRR